MKIDGDLAEMDFTFLFSLFSVGMINCCFADLIKHLSLLEEYFLAFFACRDITDCLLFRSKLWWGFKGGEKWKVRQMKTKIVRAKWHDMKGELKGKSINKIYFRLINQFRSIIHSSAQIFSDSRYKQSRNSPSTRIAQTGLMQSIWRVFAFSFASKHTASSTLELSNLILIRMHFDWGRNNFLWNRINSARIALRSYLPSHLLAFDEIWYFWFHYS